MRAFLVLMGVVAMLLVPAGLLAGMYVNSFEKGIMLSVLAGALAIYFWHEAENHPF